MTYKLFEVELFDFQLCINKWLIFNWIVSDTEQYLEPFNYVQKNELRVI